MRDNPSADSPSGLRKRGLLVRERYGLVLVLILLVYVISGFGDGPIINLVGTLIWAGLLLTAVWAPGIPDRLRHVTSVVALLLAIATAALAISDDRTVTGAMHFLFATAQFLALLAILNRIGRHDRVTVQTVMGALAGYALIGFAMASVFRGSDLVADATFLNGVVDNGDYLYFSFVTLTTVGYGDITAASILAKRLVVVEAFVGQVFMVTLVARLVALWGKPLTRSR